MVFRMTALAAVIAAITTPAMAQYGWRGEYGPGPYDGNRSYERPYDDGRSYGAQPYREDYGISRYEVMSIVRSANLQPISRPWRAGANFAVQAVNPRGQTVRVLVDARRGHILSVAAVDMPPPGPPGPRVAPDQRNDGLAPRYEEQDNPGPPPRPVPNAKGPGATNHTAAVTPAHPPMPRPRPAEAPAPAAAVKPAPDAADPATTGSTPPAPPAAAPEPAPRTETAPPAPPAESPKPAGQQAFPPVAPLD